MPVSDEKGRPNPSEMTEREMLEEMLLRSRQLEDQVLEFVGSMSTNPMFKMMGMKGMFGK